MQGPGVIIAGSGRGSAFARKLIHDSIRPVAAMVDTNTDIHPQLRKRFAEEYGSPETVVLSSLEEALARFPKETADTVLIVTPNNTHAELLRLTLEAGRHALLEKPAAADKDDLLKIAELVRHTEQVIQLGFVLRYSPLWHKVVEIAQSGKLGTIAMIQQNEWIDFAHSGNAYRRGWRRKQALTGGFMNEKCSHDIDLICAMKEKESRPRRVYSVAGTQMFQRENTPEKCSICPDSVCQFRWRPLPPGHPHYQLAERSWDQCVYHSDADIFNIQSLTLTFEDGTQAIHTLVPYTGGEARRTLHIHGTEGYLHAVQTETDCLLETAFYREDGAKIRRTDFPNAADGHGGGDSFILTDLFRCIREKTTPEATVYDGLRASWIAFSADESARIGNPVELTEALQRLC